MKLLQAIYVILIFACSMCTGAMGMTRIELSDGSSITASVIAEKTGRVFVDIGFTVLEIPMDSIVATEDLSSRETDSGFNESLYRIVENAHTRAVKDLVESLGSSVVSIRTATGLGSGFIIHPDGYVITNAHVIAGENKISVTVFETTGTDRKILKKNQYDNIRIISASAEWDLALLKIDGDDIPKFQTVPIGNMDDLKQGQAVFAIGNPLGLERSVSQGIVSTPNRLISGRLFVQSTAQINSGNSGGPLFNLKGEVVGVNNMKIVSQGAEGLGFAIPTGVLTSFLKNRDAFAFDPRNPNNGYRYNSPPSPIVEKEEL
jgi:serine protease Do